MARRRPAACSWCSRGTARPSTPLRIATRTISTASGATSRSTPTTRSAADRGDLALSADRDLPVPGIDKPLRRRQRRLENAGLTHEGDDRRQTFAIELAGSRQDPALGLQIIVESL